MLEFPKEYFLDEEIEGFLVDSTMKTVWAAELEVLNEVAYICAKHGLQWYAAYGTLLGAVRHQGFIPWDDDIDIWMKREDYRQLIKLLPEELPEGYVVRGPHARAGYPEYQVYVNNSDSISIEPEHLKEFHGCPFYVGIDIFPLDAIPDEPERADMQKSLFAGALMLQQFDSEERNAAKQAGKVVHNNIKIQEDAVIQIGRLLDKLQTNYGICISRELLIKEERPELLARLWKAAEELPFQKTSKGAGKLAMYLDYIKYGKVYEAEWFEQVDYLSYEGFDVPVPADYEAVLRVIYGDYTKLVRNTALHDYPCYKRQLEELRKRVAEAEGINNFS